MDPESGHEPVMLAEVLRQLALRSDGRYLDLTLGGGGHARGILRSAAHGSLVGVDRDREVLARTAEALQSTFGDRFRGVRARFDQWDEVEPELVGEGFDGVLLDLGASSIQLDDPERGFSFRAEAALDLRMDPREGESAAAMLQRVDERALADLLWQLGDERRSRSIARAVVERRRSAPIRTTAELADLVVRAVGRARAGRIHPATRTFQALRMAVNDELGCLERVLPKTARWLRPGGRLAVLSFHSGEDRVVKRFLRRSEAEGTLRLPFRKPLVPTPEETRRNRRARSAKLRVAERPGPGVKAPGERETQE